MTATSGDTGAFLFPQVPVGTYKLTVTLEGFRAAEFTDVNVAVGQQYSLTARLSLGALVEIVAVAELVGAHKLAVEPGKDARTEGHGFVPASKVSNCRGLYRRARTLAS